MSREADPGRDRICGTEQFDVARDRGPGVEDRVVAEAGFVCTDALGVLVAEAVVGEAGGAALGVLNDGNLKQVAFGPGGFCELAD